jgi:hypothetical protein
MNINSSFRHTSKVFAALVCLSACDVSAEQIDPKALHVLELSRETQASFAVISEVTVAFEGMQKQSFVGGEFHSGDNHRIEDPNHRSIANCKLQTGYRLEVATMKLLEGQQAAIGVCGIGHRDGLTSLRLLDVVEYKYGKAQRVEAVDSEFRRTYDVLPNGAIVRNIWQTNTPTASAVYQSEVVAYCEKALPESFFTKTSIEKKVLPDVC